MRRFSLISAVVLACMLLPVMAQGATAPVIAHKPGQIEPAKVVDRARMDSARKLVRLMELENTFDQMFLELSPVVAQGMIGAMQGDATTKNAVDALISQGEGGHDRLVAILSEEFLAAIRAQYPALSEQIAKEYAAAFETEELEQIAAFYQSGAGAKMLRLTPELQKNMSKFGSELGAVAGENAGMKGFERALKEMLPNSGNTKS